MGGGRARNWGKKKKKRTRRSRKRVIVLNDSVPTRTRNDLWTCPRQNYSQGPPAEKKTERPSLLNPLSCRPGDPITQRTELNWTVLLSPHQLQLQHWRNGYIHVVRGDVHFLQMDLRWGRKRQTNKQTKRYVQSSVSDAGPYQYCSTFNTSGTLGFQISAQTNF